MALARTRDRVAAAFDQLESCLQPLLRRDQILDEMIASLVVEKNQPFIPPQLRLLVERWCAQLGYQFAWTKEYDPEEAARDPGKEEIAVVAPKNREAPGP